MSRGNLEGTTSMAAIKSRQSRLISGECGSLLALFEVPRTGKAPASRAHSKRFATDFAKDVVPSQARVPCRTLRGRTIVILIFVTYRSIVGKL
jgi:hypothetical protein